MKIMDSIEFSYKSREITILYNTLYFAFGGVVNEFKACVTW
jgi:hypothetical protein